MPQLQSDALPPQAIGAVPLLRALGLFDQAANGPALDDVALERFATRQLPFDWVHMGNSEISLGHLVAVIQDCFPLKPPRTGHIGNWENIVHARAGPRDYNNMTCGGYGLGYPLLFDLNQTESDTPRLGDWSYLPGSIVRRCKRKVLDLLTWSGSSFRRRDRSAPLFTPFVLANVDGDLIPLTLVHRQACLAHSHFDFRFQSTFVLSHGPLVRAVLCTLLRYACEQDQPNVLLRRIFDRQVALDGQVERCALHLSAGNLRMAETTYASAEELVDHAMLPLQAAAFPVEFVRCVRDMPTQMPLMSAVTLVLLLAVLNAHFPNIATPAPELTSPCNPHLHWGGIPMAGYPPRDRGYFADNTRHLRKLMRPIVSQMPEIAPVYFVLLPAGIFNLCPNDAFPEDAERVSALAESIIMRTDQLTGRPAEMSQCIEAVARDWWTTQGYRLSEYFSSRFAPRPSIVSSLAAPLDGELVILPNLARLTIQQASMTMGALSKLPWRNRGDP